jgi:SAM-dependent methyltransferase
MTTTRCALCGSTSSNEVFRFLRPKEISASGRPTESLYGRAGRLVRCDECGLVRQDVPADAPYEEAEDPEYLNEEPGLRETFRRNLLEIARHRPPPGRLLDVGCGPGLLLEEAVALGWTAVGVEPSAWAVEEGRRRGLEILQGTTDTVDLEARSFDVVVANDVVEHVPDPLAFGRRLHELLKPGGVVYLCTPDVSSAVARVLRRWWWSVLPGHLFYFSPTTLARVLETSGFRVLASGRHPKTFSLEYYAGRLVGYSESLGRVVRKATKPFGGPGRLVSPNFRDRMAMIAIRDE